ncbi:phage terminase small subunit P27 family [Micromonospora sp. WMMA1363]|uniref:phage terminase small subunit P27 family n=1 Tax=Micromonospora sp. WMMA1363 TaxID=3053985 RepID=UPI00259CC42F|nr:phage terminase small subunit P27 family [Micromonospora sp. WMMA1363]MDM4721832.1 phage terminase small subunit P27 family [Micromonospora sp. WMMA1363]
MRHVYASACIGGVGVADRKNSDLKVLRGNPGNRAVSPKGGSVTGRPVPPADLTGEAFAEWARITAYLERVGRIEAVDYAALVVYCSAWALFDGARRALDDHGPLVVGRDGGLVKNPAAQVMRDASDTMLKFGGRFGFTPRDRQNLGIGVHDDGGDDLDSALDAL